MRYSDKVLTTACAPSPDGSVCFASEMKALQTRCVQFQQFPAGARAAKFTGLANFWADFRPLIGISSQN